MPTYELRCPVCSQQAAVKASYDESFPYPSCQFCLIQMERIWTSNPIHFKGTGWGKD